MTDALGHATSYTYSSLNQQLTHTDALNAVTKFEYDANGNLSKATDAKGNATAYAYDALDQNTAITFANGASLQYTYDELGNVIASRDRAGNEFRYAYNALGNLLAKTYPDGTTDRYSYDRVSRMLSAINKDATVTFAYDKANRLLAETLNGKTTSYTYDVAAGKRTLTYPSGMKVEEHLNARGLIATILQDGNEVVTMDYNVAGQKTRQAYANGVATDYGYNENGWLASIKDDHKVIDLAMAYDAIGNMTQRADNLDAARTESYGYDVISQLTYFTRGKTVSKTYEFDLLGNRVKTVENGVITNYTANNVNAYTAVSGGLSFTPSYDGNGNLLNDDKHQYAYDYNNKLATVGNKSVVYKYDALGRRVAKNNTTYYYAGDQMVEESTDGTVTSYLYGNNIDEALQMSRKGTAYYYHTNHLGSTMGLSDTKGNVVERVEYDVYGMPTFMDADGNVLEASAMSNNILFTGREYDAETGDYFFRARSMHPMVGRFMQKDPLGYVDGMNDYAYCLNNSIYFIDPFGTDLVSKVEGIYNISHDYNLQKQRIKYNAQNQQDVGEYLKKGKNRPPLNSNGAKNIGAKNIGAASKGIAFRVLGYLVPILVGIYDGYCDDYGRNAGPLIATGAGMGAIVGGIAGYCAGTVAGATVGSVAGIAAGAVVGLPAAGVGAVPTGIAGGVAGGTSGAGIGGVAGTVVGAGVGAATGAATTGILYTLGYLFGKIHPFGN